MPPKIAAAICKTKLAIGSADKDGEGVDGERTFSYPTVDSFFRAVRKPMADHGLILETKQQGYEFLMLPDEEGNQRPHLNCIFRMVWVHEEGDVYDHPENLVPMASMFRGPQTIGALRSYAKKYFLKDVFEIPATGPGEELDAWKGARDENPMPQAYRDQVASKKKPAAPGADFGPLIYDEAKSAVQRMELIDEVQKAISTDGVNSAFKVHQTHYARLTDADKVLVQSAVTAKNESFASA